MSFSFSSWCSWTKQVGWVNLRFYLFVSGVNQVEWGRELSQRFPFVTPGVWELPFRPTASKVAFILFIKRRLQQIYFLVINAQFLRAPFLKIISERLLLKTYPVVLFWILKRISEKNSSLSVIKTFAKFLGNHICWSLFSIKLLIFNVKFY